MADTTAEVETPTIEVYPSFTELDSKADIIEHLRNVHGVGYIAHQSITGAVKNVKVTKEEMLKYHTAWHSAQESADGMWRWESKASFDHATNTYMGMWIPMYRGSQHVTHHGQIVLPHKHAGLEESAELRAAAVAARMGGTISDKPLPPSQLRLLMEIVRQDFRILEEEMREFATESLEARIKEIRADFKTREGDAPKLKAKAEKLHAQTMEKLRKLRDDAAEAGIILTIPTTTAVVNFQIKGLNEAVKLAQDENRSALTRALSRLEREKAVSLRRVQLAGISADAVKLLDEMPNARQMMIEAAAERPVKELG